jgi:hypothetical protein
MLNISCVCASWGILGECEQPMLKFGGKYPGREFKASNAALKKRNLKPSHMDFV